MDKDNLLKFLEGSIGGAMDMYKDLSNANSISKKLEFFVLGLIAQATNVMIGVLNIPETEADKYINDFRLLVLERKVTSEDED